jgi:hypothetical protein
LEQKAVIKEFEELERQYHTAVIGRHKCQIDEIRTDQNDALRAQILELLMYDIYKKYYDYRNYVHSRHEILNNTSLEQHVKLSMMKKSRQFHNKLRKTYGNKSYGFFKQLMENIVTTALSHEKREQRLLEQKKAEEKAKIMGVQSGFMNAMSKKILRERDMEKDTNKES